MWQIIFTINKNNSGNSNKPRTRDVLSDLTSNGGKKKSPDFHSLRVNFRTFSYTIKYFKTDLAETEPFILADAPGLPDVIAVFVSLA